MRDTSPVERLDPSDLVAIAQCHALHASVFPRANLVVFASAAPLFWIARGQPGGAVIGFAAAERQRTGLELVAVAVERARRGRGLGRALARAAADGAAHAGYDELRLHVSVANTAAIAAYDAAGFHVDRRLAGYYPYPSFGAGGDAYLMIKALL